MASPLVVVPLRPSVATLLLLGSILLVPQQRAAALASASPSKSDGGESIDDFFCESKRHVHLSVGQDPATTMTVSFSSDPCDGVARAEPRSGSGGQQQHPPPPPPPHGGVMIGTSPDKLTRLVLERNPARRYNATLEHGKGTYWSEYQRHVEVTGLQPGTRYYFRCVTIDDGWSRVSWGADRPEVRIDEEGEGETRHTKFAQRKDRGAGDGPPPRGDEEETDERVRRQRWLRKAGPKKAIQQMKETGMADPWDEVPSFVTAPKRGEYRDSAQPKKVQKSVGLEDEATAAATATAATAHKVKFAIIGDVAQTKPAIDTLAHLDHNRHDISAVLLVGDIAYANTRHKLWDSWFDMCDLFSVFREKPLQVAAGNHEVERDKNSAEIFVAYENRFAMPQVQPVEVQQYHHGVHTDNVPYPMPYDYGNSYYAFQYGPTHNIMLNSFAAFHPGSKQHDWLLTELGAVDRTQTPWLTVTLHCPMYNTFQWHRKETQSVLAKEHLEPLFVANRVNFVFSGHLHAYMRTAPVAEDRRHRYGPIHIILGNGGRQANSPYHHKKPEKWVEVRDHTTFGYGTLEFVNATHSKYAWVQTDVNTEGGRAGIDQEEIIRGVKDDAYIENQLFL